MQPWQYVLALAIVLAAIALVVYSCKRRWLKNFNYNHPETREGETFLTNIDEKGFFEIGWQTKRRGVIAYTKDGRILQENFPVFVQKSEMEEKGINPAKVNEKYFRP